MAYKYLKTGYLDKMKGGHSKNKTVRIRAHGYNVTVGHRALTELSLLLNKKKYSQVFILCDENTLQHCLPFAITSCPLLSNAEIIEIEAGEQSKSLEIAARIWETFIENKGGRDSLLVNLGGGVVSDLGSFCASIYKRGIDFVNIPTSLLAMADASVGGKTGIDFAGLKNSLGTFKQPLGVFVNPVFLETLPGRHISNGMAEIFKIALVADKKFWEKLTKNEAPKDLEKWISAAITLKNKIVLKDPYDKGERKKLNFGHTIGHALEAVKLGTAEEFLHGEAVICGIICESHIAWQKKILSRQELSNITTALTPYIKQTSRGINTEEIIPLIQQDKKNKKEKLLCAFIKTPGTCLIDQEISITQVKKAIDFYNGLKNA